MAASLRELRHDFAVQRHVIGAIMLREYVSRWGRRNLGFAWLFAEPLVFAFPVIAVWSYVRAPFEHGLPMTAFVWTGYMPILVFRHVTGGAILSLRSNAAILYHRRVTPFDMFIGRQGMEALGNIGSIAFSFFVLAGIHAIPWPEDYHLMMTGFIYTVWWSLCVALVLTTLSERFEIVPHIWAPISYLYIFYSGFFWLADWIPSRFREIVLAIDPPLHCYEMVRGGMFGPHLMHPHYHLAYVTWLLSAWTLVGLWLLRDVRKHIELE